MSTGRRCAATLPAPIAAPQPGNIGQVALANIAREVAFIRRGYDASLFCRRLERDGIPITTPARTLYDLAFGMTRRELERAVTVALEQRLTTRSHLLALLRRHRGRQATARIIAQLEAGSEPALTRSEAEERFLGLIHKARLHKPGVNVTVEGHEVDFYWRSEGLIVEGGWTCISLMDRAFESDRRRDAVLVAAGLRVMCVTWRQMLSEPEAMLVRLAQALARTARPCPS